MAQSLRTSFLLYDMLAQVIDSPLKRQPAAVAVYSDGSGYCVASTEGRCSIRYTDREQDEKNSFSFKTQRKGASVSVRMLCV